MKNVYLHQKRRKSQRKRRLVFYNGIICSIMVCSNVRKNGVKGSNYENNRRIREIDWQEG